MKCPACGFETPDAQGWCDFCKEPFKRPAKAEPAPPPPPPAPPKEPAPAKEAKPPMSDEEIFALLRKDTASERPAPSPFNTRYLAWGFFGLVVFWMVVMSFFLVQKGRRMQEGGVSPHTRPGDTEPSMGEPPVFQPATDEQADGGPR